MWREPLPVLLLIVTAFIVNLRHFLMAASISRISVSFRNGFIL